MTGVFIIIILVVWYWISKQVEKHHKDTDYPDIEQRALAKGKYRKKEKKD